jgi:exoribonuclease-2
MFIKGNLVLYKGQAALVKAIADKITIEYCSIPATATGKAAKFSTQNVRNKDIMLLHQGPATNLPESVVKPDEKTDAINGTDNATTNNTAILDRLFETWELLSDEELEVCSFNDIADLTVDDFTPESAWNLYVTLLSNPYFELLDKNSKTIQLKTEDTILQFKLRSKEDAEAIQKKQNTKEQASELYTAFIKRLKDKKLILPDDGIYMGDVEALALGKTDKSKTMNDAAIAQSPQKAHKLLIDTGIWPFWRNPHPSRLGLSKKSANIHLSHPIKEERLIIDHIAYAIDSEDSTDPDDAIAYDGKYLWVHIADPASTVTPDSDIDKAARDRGATLYLPEGAARMLAEESLEDYALGLREENATAEGKDINIPEQSWSQALSFKIELAEDGSVKDCNVMETLVHVKRLSYKQADLERENSDLAPLYAIAKKNIDRRVAAGSVNIDLPEANVKVKLPEGGDVEKQPEIYIEPYTPYESNIVVREAMLLAGEGAATFAFKNQIPFPYVSQEEPEIPAELPEGLAGEYKKRRCMHRRSVGITPSKHAALGIYMYSQVTSPLRRYGDLISHEQLHAFLDKKTLLDKDTMLERISAGDAAGRASVKAERNSTIHWKLVFFKQHPEWQGEAIIAELNEQYKQATILIPSIALERRIPLQEDMKLNQSFMVKPVDINIPELSVNFIKA